MATFLKLCQQVRKLGGLQGTGPISVTTVQGTEEAIVQMVIESYTEIQNRRRDWEWMERSHSFFTGVGQEEYTYQNIFGTATPDHSEYHKQSVRITDNEGTVRYLKYIDRDVLEARYLNNTDQKLPTEYTIDPSTQGLILRPIPDDVYTVDFRYQRTPEILSLDTDIPSLPAQFHDVIIYKALMKLAVYLGIPELFQSASMDYERTMGQLMRKKVPKKVLKRRPFV